MIKVIFVCLGNICRSPAGEGIFRHLVEKENLVNDVIVSSCGIGDWHLGSRPKFVCAKLQAKEAFS